MAAAMSPRTMGLETVSSMYPPAFRPIGIRTDSPAAIAVAASNRSTGNGATASTLATAQLPPAVLSDAGGLALLACSSRSIRRAARMTVHIATTTPKTPPNTIQSLLSPKK